MLGLWGLPLGQGDFALGLRGFALGPQGFLRYQHVGIGNVNHSHWGLDQMQSPNASGFMLQSNIELAGNHIQELCNVR